MTELVSLNKLLAAHFEPLALEGLVVTRRDFPHWMRPDLQKALEALFAGLPGARFTSARIRDRDFDFRFADLAEAGEGIAVGPAEYQDVDIGEAHPVRCLSRGLWLAERDSVRFALLLDVREGYHGIRVRLEIAAPPGAGAARLAVQAAEHLRADAERGVSWRGKVLVLERAQDDFDVSPAGLRVAKTVPVGRNDIVLPEKTLALIERNTLGFVHQAQQLVRLGLSAKKGVLLYGPPGTGKTLIVRWLATALEGYTKLIVTAGHYGLLEETFEIARALFVLTTNRPEVLEPALAARPGRVDRAIEVGFERRQYAWRCQMGKERNRVNPDGKRSFR